MVYPVSQSDYPTECPMLQFVTLRDADHSSGVCRIGSENMLDDAIFTALHSALTHLDFKDSSVKTKASWLLHHCDQLLLHSLPQNHQRLVRAAEKITGALLPSLQDNYNTWLTREALGIVGDPSHPSPSFFSRLPSGRRLQATRQDQQTQGQLHPLGCQEAPLFPCTDNPLPCTCKLWTLTPTTTTKELHFNVAYLYTEYIGLRIKLIL